MHELMSTSSMHGHLFYKVDRFLYTSELSQCLPQLLKIEILLSHRLLVSLPAHVYTSITLCVLPLRIQALRMHVV